MRNGGARTLPGAERINFEAVEILASGGPAVAEERVTGAEPAKLEVVAPRIEADQEVAEAPFRALIAVVVRRGASASAAVAVAGDFREEGDRGAVADGAGNDGLWKVSGFGCGFQANSTLDTRNPQLNIDVGRNEVFGESN